MRTLKKNKFALLLSLSLILAAVGAVSTGQPSGTAANADLLNEIDSTVKQDISRLAGLARSPNEDQEDVNRTLILDGGGSWDGNQATSNNNPTLTTECHEGAMQQALETMMTNMDLDHDHAVEKIEGHIRERQAFEKSGITYGDYIAHVAECKNLCNVVVTELVGCHIRAVANFGPELVVFDINKHSVNPNDYRSNEAIRSIARRLKDEPAKNVLLIGRGSRTGDIGYNRRLSGLRAASIGNRLSIDHSVNTSRIKPLAFGYEPPQITAEIAQAYDMHDLYRQEGDHRANQSVLMVVY